MRFQVLVLGPCWVMEADIWSPGETSPTFTGGAG